MSDMGGPLFRVEILIDCLTEILSVFPLVAFLEIQPSIRRWIQQPRSSTLYGVLGTRKWISRERQPIARAAAIGHPPSPGMGSDLDVGPAGGSSRQRNDVLAHVRKSI